MNNKKLKDGHFYAMAWDKYIGFKPIKTEVIVTDVCGDECIAVRETYKHEYFKNELYKMKTWDAYERIEEPKRRDMLPIELAGKWVKFNDGVIHQVIRFNNHAIHFGEIEYTVRQLQEANPPCRYCDTPNGEFSTDFTTEVE